jgi:D-glutamate cyclase
MTSRVQALENIGWQLDHLMALDTSGKGRVGRLYGASVESNGGRPLTLAAAQALKAQVRPGSVVGILTGFPSRSFLLEGVTETDGPVGAAVLARFVEEVLGAIPIIFTEERVAKFSRNCCTVAGLLIGTPQQALSSKVGPHTAAVAAVVPISTDHEEARQQAAEYIDRFQPTALIAIEQPGLAADGFAYTAAGRRITDHLLAKLDYLFDEAEKRGVLRIGIGDNGNEVGMGRIKDAVHKTPNGPTIAASRTSDYLLAAGNSNWGGYALGGAIEVVASGGTRVLRRLDVPAILRRCAEDGAIDGVSSRPEPYSDGTPPGLNQSVIDLMAWSIEVAMESVGR